MDILFTSIGVEFVSKIVVQGNIFNLNRWRTKEENEQNHHGFLSIALHRRMNGSAGTTLEYQNEPSPEVFQEAKIYTCEEVVVRITDDSPSLNGILHFARRFLNKMRTGRGWKESIAQFGEQELTSFVKRTIEGVLVCQYCYQTRTISYISPRVELYDRSWARQILSDAWVSMIAETKLAIEDQPRTLIKESLEVECRKFYVWSVNIEGHGHMGSCPRNALLIWQAKARTPREDVFPKQIGRIIERTLAGEASQDGENLGRRSQDENIQAQNRSEKASPREEKRSN